MIHCPSLARIINHPARVCSAGPAKFSTRSTPSLVFSIPHPGVSSAREITQGRLIQLIMMVSEVLLLNTAQKPFSCPLVPFFPVPHECFITLLISSLYSVLGISKHDFFFPTPKRTQNFSGRKLLFKMICGSSLPALLASLGICIFFLFLFDLPPLYLINAGLLIRFCFKCYLFWDTLQYSDLSWVLCCKIYHR